MGKSVDYYAGDKHALAKLLEQAAPMADEMNLWALGLPARSIFTELAEYLRRVANEETMTEANEAVRPADGAKEE